MFSKKRKSGKGLPSTTFLWKSGAGFTLIEILIVFIIIIILSIIVLANYKAGQQQLALQRAASKLAQDIRGAQEMAMGAEEFEGEVPDGVGLCFKEVPGPHEPPYLIFADKNNNQSYDLGADGLIKEIFLEQGIKIKDLDKPNIYIVFKPPDPQVFIGPGLDSATIIISLKDNETKTKTITINKAGLIDID